MGLVVAGILFWTIENKPEDLGQFREIRIQVPFGETQENIDLRTPLPNDTAQLQFIEPSNQQKSQKGHSVFVDSIGFASFTANGDSIVNVRDTFDANLFYSNRKDSIRLIATILPAIKPDTITEREPLQELELRFPDDISRLIIDPEEQAEMMWWKKMEWPIKLSLMLFLGALLWGIWRWYQYKKAKVIAELKKADKAPYIWNPETNEINEEWLEEVTRPLLNRFRGRTPVDNILIDIPATIAATSKQAGRLDLQYQYRTLPPNYLLLIDRFDGQDHQARLFDALYQNLKKAEVPVFRYYYNGDPRVCHNEAFPNGITLVELLHKHASARLLMVGEGLSLLSPVSGRLSPWTSIIKKWSNRALLSPKSYEKWGLVEKELQDLMLVLPASPQGLGMAIEAFLAIDKPTTLELLPKVKDAIQKPITFDQPLMSILKKEYKEPVLDWIAACAIWPKLSWDLTLHLGQIIGDHHNENLLSFAHLREMNRLPWFLQGQIPQRAREILLDYLAESGLEEKVRRSLDTLLDQNPPPKDSVAYQDYRMNIIINKLFLKPDTAARKKLEKEFAQYLAAGNKPDFVAFRLLDRPLSRLDTSVGHKLKQLAFKEGLPGLGLKQWPKLLFIGIFLWIGIGFLPLGEGEICDGNTIAYNQQTLCLNNAKDSLLYLQNLAKDAIYEQNHERVDSIRLMADAIQALDSAFYLNTAYNYYNYSILVHNCDIENNISCLVLPPKDSLEGLSCFNIDRAILFSRIIEIEKLDSFELLRIYLCSIAEMNDNVDLPIIVNNETIIQDSFIDSILAQVSLEITLQRQKLIEVSIDTTLWTFSLSKPLIEEIILISRSALSNNGDEKRQLFNFLAKSNLDSASFNTIIANVRFSGLDLQQINLIKAHLRYSDFSFSNLSGSDLRRADLSYSDLFKTNFQFANLNQVDMSSASAEFADFSFTSLQQSYLAGVDFTNAKFIESDLNSSIITNANLEGVDLTNSILINTKMNGVNLNRAILDGVDLSGADLNLIKNITFEQLLSAKTLYRSENLDPLIEKQLRVVKSCLFEDPNSLNGCKEDIFLPVPPTELVPAGTFTMGCLSEERDGQCNDDEKPAREVKVDTFYMGKYEVTNEEFAAFLNAKGNQEEGEITWVNLSGSFQGVKCRIQKDGDRFVVEEGFEKYPMIYVSCYGARAYCKWLSEQTGQNYRLPSEAEWEYAARGGEQGARDNFLYSGSDNIDEVAWYANNSGRQIYEVGKKQPNQLDLYDMSGNIWEWCADSWHDNYDNAPKNAKVWDEGGDNTRRVLRGGSWFNTSEVYCRIADRYGDYLVDRFNFVGFRVVRDP